MSSDPISIVQASYDHIAPWYLQWIENQKSPRERYTAYVLEKSTPQPAILELGCGPGIPVLKMPLEHGADVVANDISRKQIETAMFRCPRAKFIDGNIADLDFEPGVYNGVLSFHTLFHIPRTQLLGIFKKIHGWLNRDGLFACSLATFDEDEIHGEFLGYGTYWSSYSAEENKALLTQAGFELLKVEIAKAGDGKLEEDEPDHDAEFMWILAQKAEKLS